MGVHAAEATSRGPASARASSGSEMWSRILGLALIISTASAQSSYTPHSTCNTACGDAGLWDMANHGATAVVGRCYHCWATGRGSSCPSGTQYVNEGWTYDDCCNAYSCTSPHHHAPHGHDPHSHNPHGHDPHNHDPHSHDPHSQATPSPSPPPPPPPGSLKLPRVAAAQSSTYSWDDSLCSASICIDDATDGSGSCEGLCHTSADSPAWLRVDLGATYDVTSLTLYNRDWGDRLAYHEFWVTNSTYSYNGGTLCASATHQGCANCLDGTASQVGPFSHTCESARTGRYVWLVLAGRTSKLDIRELIVYGNEVQTSCPGSVTVRTDYMEVTGVQILLARGVYTIEYPNGLASLQGNRPVYSKHTSDGSWYIFYSENYGTWFATKGSAQSCCYGTPLLFFSTANSTGAACPTDVTNWAFRDADGVLMEGGGGGGK